MYDLHYKMYNEPQIQVALYQNENAKRLKLYENIQPLQNITILVSDDGFAHQGGTWERNGLLVHV